MMNDHFPEITDAFLAQSYQDAWSDYQNALESDKVAHWDWVVITASNEKQAQSYQTQINLRLHKGSLPSNVCFAVVPDPEGQRVGSGGATLNALRHIKEQTKGKADFNQLKIMIMHSGGDSKRVPQYSARGKLFEPVPRQLPNGVRSTLFDEILIGVSSVPARIGAGVLIMPGDTQILFNPLQLDLKVKGAAALSIKTSVAEGKNHGVFLNGADGKVERFLHKQAEHVLQAAGAVNKDGNVNIDTGSIWLGSEIVTALYSLISTNGELDAEKCNVYINDFVRLSFYADFLFPLASHATLEDYLKEIPEGDFSEELSKCRKNIWDILSGFDLHLIKMTPAKYIHFGSTHELFDLMTKGIDRFQYLGWKKSVCCNRDFGDAAITCNNVVIDSSAQISPFVYLENSIVGGNVSVGRNTILSGVQLYNKNIPNGVVLHGLELADDRYVVRIYGIEDNPKSSPNGAFLGTTLKKFIEGCGAAEDNVWSENSKSLWNAKIYPVCKSEEQALEEAMRIYRIAIGAPQKDDVSIWLKCEKTSLKDSFSKADTQKMLKKEQIIENTVCVEKSIQLLREKKNMDDALVFFHENQLVQQGNILSSKLEGADFSLKMRIFMLFSALCKKYGCCLCGFSSEQYEDQCYNLISESIVDATDKRWPINDESLIFTKDSIEIKLPVRVNFCGSPSDAAPFCLENGGTMLNAALSLKGQLPISVVVKRLNKPIVMVESIDLNAALEITTAEEVRACDNPYDTFALHKAILVACGIVPIKGCFETLESRLTKMGGGISISTSVNVPKGSGLGTSSIIAAAGVKAINTILGQDISDAHIYAQVFAVEQLMATGGGWQDQVGGLPNGMKLIYSTPGLYQDLKVDQVQLPKQVQEELQDRFALIFSGQRRLARNVLRQEMNQCISNNPIAMQAVERIRQLCVLMRYELERSNIDAFGQYITEQFELVKKLDKGASNTCIEYIFKVCDDLLEGKSICGAGGGGFLQVILKKGVTKEQLKQRLEQVFQDCGVEFWDSAFI